MLARSFLFESSSKLLVTRTGIKAWSSSNLVQIRQLILELLALEWRKFHTFELEYLWSEVANLDQILCVASLGWGKGCIRFWGWLTLARWTQVSDRCPLGYLFYCVKILNCIFMNNILLLFLKLKEGIYWFQTDCKWQMGFNCQLQSRSTTHKKCIKTEQYSKQSRKKKNFECYHDIASASILL